MSTSKPLTENRLQEALLDRSDSINRYVRSRIPARYQGIVSAEEILQDVWTAAFIGLPTFRDDGPDALDRFISTLIRNTLVNHVRFARAKKRHPIAGFFAGACDRKTSLSDFFSKFVSPDRTPASEVSAREAAEAVRTALRGLPELNQRAIVMRYLQGHSRDQIATALNRTGPAINALLFRSLRVLRNRLRDAGNYFTDAKSSEREP